MWKKNYKQSYDILYIAAIMWKKYSYVQSYVIHVVAYFHKIKFLWILIVYNSRYKQFDKYVGLCKKVFGCSKKREKVYVKTVNCTSLNS